MTCSAPPFVRVAEKNPRGVLNTPSPHRGRVKFYWLRMHSRERERGHVFCVFAHWQRRKAYLNPESYRPVGHWYIGAWIHQLLNSSVCLLPPVAVTGSWERRFGAIRCRTICYSSPEAPCHCEASSCVKRRRCHGQPAHFTPPHQMEGLLMAPHYCIWPLQLSVKRPLTPQNCLPYGWGYSALSTTDAPY